MSAAQTLLTSAKYTFRYPVEGTFSDRQVTLLNTSLERFFDVVGDGLGGTLLASGMNIRFGHKGGNNFRLPYQIRFTPNNLTEWTIVHELGHALDASYGWKLSQRMRIETGSGFLIKSFHRAFPKWRLFWYRVGSPPPPCGVNDKFNSLEDFAETVTAYIFPERAKEKAASRGFNYEKYGYAHFHETPRGRYFQKLLDEATIKAPSI